MENPVEFSSKVPSSSTFSFTAPFPVSQSASSSSAAHKQRRVSLALPSSPRLFPAWSFRDDTGLGVHSGDPTSLVPEKKGKMRRIENSNDRPDDDLAQPQLEKKPRKKWTTEETQMLVKGCNKVFLAFLTHASLLNVSVSQWGVGNWKSILNDSEFKFDNRSPVDLKDRYVSLS